MRISYPSTWNGITVISIQLKRKGKKKHRVKKEEKVVILIL
jgi:hypothetical protein